MFYFLTFLLGMITFTSVQASDVFGFLLPGCQFKYGLPVNYQDGHLAILTPDGKITNLSSEEIQGIAHYVLSENVFHLSSLNSDATNYLKTIQIKESNLILRGFPYQFIDETFFILDLKGARRVIGFDELGRVEKNSSAIKIHNKKKYLPLLSLPSGVANCQDQKSGLMPSRYLGDKIQILETIHNWEKGFRNLDDLAERSVFYPQPFLFDQHDRFGFLSFKEDKPSANLIPVRYSFSNGEDFRFQGHTTFGGGFSKIGPRVKPMNILASDLKFHFLHASFEGNITAMGVGSSYYSRETEYREFAEKNPKVSEGDVLFNHLALIGFDWSHWGISFGPIFPIFYIQSGLESREITPQKSVPVARLTWTGEVLKLKLMAGSGNLDAKSNLGKKSNVISSSNEFAESVDSYRIDFNYIRGGIDWNVIEGMIFSSDVVLTNWEYHERLEGKQLNYKSKDMNLLLAVNRAFSDYVSLGFFLIWNRPLREASFEETKFNDSKVNTNLGGSFEFLF